MWGQIINVLVGLCIVVAPSWLPYSNAGADSSHVVGPLIMTFAITAIWEVNRNARYANIVCGAWLVVAPWVLGYTATSTIVNDILMGALCIVFSLVKGKVSDRYCGGWASLWKKSPTHYQKIK